MVSIYSKRLKFEDFCRIIIAFVFIVSSISKIFSFSEFISDINTLFNIKIISSFVALGLIILELILGILLLLNFQLKFAYFMAISLFLLFLLYLGIQVFNGNTTTCNCFGNLFQRTPLEAFIEDLIFLIILLIPFQEYMARQKKNKIFI